METLKFMQLVCLFGVIFSIVAIDHNQACWATLLFFLISGLFFNSAIKGIQKQRRINRKLIELNNDLYEHSNY